MSAVAPAPTPTAPAPPAALDRIGAPAPRPWWRAPRVQTAAGLVMLVAVSVYLRTHAINAKFWIDEGLSVGIAHHGLFDIPSVLRKDGSPPLYYMLLNVWMTLVGGDGEARTHALSLLFAVTTVPVGWWAGRRLFGVRSGWATAALSATCPFLTYYAQETRMYALVTLLGLAASAAFALAYAQRDRRAVPAFGVLMALTSYAHNWGLFLAMGMAAAFVVLWRTAPAADRSALGRDGLLGFGILAALYAPWVPSLAFQAAHTGAPWAEAPPLNGVVTGLQVLVGGVETALLVAVVGVAGLLTLRRHVEGRPRARAALALGVALGAAVLLAWIASQASPAWATRYFSVFLGPALLLAGAGLVRFGTVGLVALAIVLVLWLNPHEGAIRGKSDAYRVVRTLKDEGLVAPRDVILTVHPEYGPTMRYYLGAGYRWADSMGFVADDRVFDWRDALERLKAAGPRRTLARVAPALAPGQRLVLIQPILRSGRWGAPWTKQIRRRVPQWERALDGDARFKRLGPVPKFGHKALPRGVRAVVYLRR